MNTSGCVLVLAHVDHQQAQVHVDLGGGQADARRVVHGLEHVVDQLANAFIHGFDRFCHGAQAGIGELDDG